MTKQEIIDSLIVSHRRFSEYISVLGDQAFSFSLNDEKWTAGQQADHICRSLFPLQIVLGFPKWFSKLIFKKANRPSKTYEELVNKYIQKLENGGRATGRFIPGRIEPGQKTILKNKIEKLIIKLSSSLHKFSEKEMDNLVLPHPLLGRLTLREMMYFTIYHVEHHHKIAIRNLDGNISGSNS
jgi:hypothetical protein